MAVALYNWETNIVMGFLSFGVQGFQKGVGVRKRDGLEKTHAEKRRRLEPVQERIAMIFLAWIKSSPREKPDF